MDCYKFEIRDQVVFEWVYPRIFVRVSRSKKFYSRRYIFVIVNDVGGCYCEFV